MLYGALVACLLSSIKFNNFVFVNYIAVVLIVIKIDNKTKRFYQRGNQDKIHIVYFQLGALTIKSS